MLQKLSLDEKTVVITGGGTGLGREMALAMANAGANLVIAGRRLEPIQNVANLAETTGRRAMAISTDVTDSNEVDHLFQRTLAEFGKVDVLFNNAGIVREQGAIPIWEITDEAWRIGIDVNLTSAFYCTRAIAKHMVDRREGKIVNVSSGFGLRGGRNNYMYACGKGGVLQLTRVLATSLGRYGITSNTIVPGFLPTEGTTKSKEILPRGDFIPIGRVGKPPEMGPIAVFLASSASDYMNGATFTADGGGLAGGYAPTGYSPEFELDLP